MLNFDSGPTSIEKITQKILKCSLGFLFDKLNGTPNISDLKRYLSSPKCWHELLEYYFKRDSLISLEQSNPLQLRI